MFKNKTKIISKSFQHIFHFIILQIHRWCLRWQRKTNTFSLLDPQDAPNPARKGYHR